MKPVSNETILAQLEWRYAVKKFDPTRAIPEADWQTLERSVVLTPSSFGIQHYSVVVVSDPAIRARLVPVSWGQTQPVDCSQFVVFAIRHPLTDADVERLLGRTVEVRGVRRDSLSQYRQLMLGSLKQASDRGYVNEWCARQAYIALGNFMTCAAMLGIDTCPMEGFAPEKYDEILGLAARGLKAVVACAAGYRAADDKYGQLKKVRLPLDEVFVRI